MKENQIDFQGCMITIEGEEVDVKTVITILKELKDVKQSKVDLRSELLAIKNGEKRGIIQDILKQEINNPTGNDEPDMDETIKKYKSEGIDSIEDLFN